MQFIGAEIGVGRIVHVERANGRIGKQHCTASVGLKTVLMRIDDHTVRTSDRRIRGAGHPITLIVCDESEEATVGTVDMYPSTVFTSQCDDAVERIKCPQSRGSQGGHNRSDPTSCQGYLELVEIHAPGSIRSDHDWLHRAAKEQAAIVAALAGKMSFAGVASAPWLDFVYPFQFGAPTFDFWSIVTMCIVMIVVMVESTGMFLALGEMTGKKIEPGHLANGLRADGVGTFLGGVFNTFPYTSFSQNVGLVGVTGVRSRWVAVAGGVILLVLGLIPKLAAVFAAIPVYVLGGAGIVMFGMVAATGIRILAGVDYTNNRHNLMIVAIIFSHIAKLLLLNIPRYAILFTIVFTKLPPAPS